MGRTVVAWVAVVLLAGVAPAVEPAKAPDVKLPPGWKVAGTLLCPRCVGMVFTADVGTCQQCGAPWTAARPSCLGLVLPNPARLDDPEPPFDGQGHQFSNQGVDQRVEIVKGRLR